MRRAMLLAALGASIGSVALALFAAPAYLLALAVRLLWQMSVPDVGTALALPPGIGVRPLLAPVADLAAAAAAAGVVTAIAAALLRVSARADWRALVVSLVAAVAWLFMTALAIGDAIWVPQRAAAVVLVGLGVGALAWLALWTPLAMALQHALGVARTVWAVARRLAGFTLGLFGALVAGQTGVCAAGALVSAVLERVPHAWAVGLAAIAVSALPLGTSFLGLYSAGIPRHWSQRQVASNAEGD